MINEIIEDIGTQDEMTQDVLLSKLNSYLKGTKLDEMINDFWKYRIKIKNEIDKKNPLLIKRLIFFFLLINDISNFIALSFEENKNKDKIKYRINVCSKLYNKSLQTFIDIFALLESGSTSNIYLLWRSIYENYILTLYFVDGPEEEARLFNEHKIIQEKRLFNEEFSKEENDKYINIFGKDYKNDFSWAKRIKGGKTISNIIKYVGENSFYQFYILSTLIGHSSSFSVNRSILSQDDIPNTGMIGYFPDKVTQQINLLLTSLTSFTKIMIKYFVNEKYRILIERLLDYFCNEINKNTENTF